MKKWKYIFSGVLTSVILFSIMGAVSAADLGEDVVRKRIRLAEQLGLTEAVDEQGYLTDEFLACRSTGELERMGVAELIRSYVPGKMLKARNAAVFAAGAGGGTVTASELVRYMNTVVGYFEVDGIQAFCAQHGVDRPLAGASTSPPVSVTDTMQRKVLYYGYTGPGQWSGIVGFEQGRTVTSLALSYYYSGADSLNWNIHGNYSTQMGLSDFIYYIEQAAVPPAGFQVWKVRTGDGSTQDMMYWKYSPGGYVSLLKKSKNTAVTSASTCYSLEGAKYGVYTDPDCTIYAKNADTGVQAVLTTDDSGKSGLLCLAEGIYYIKEIHAPKGYVLNTETVRISVSSAHTASSPAVAEVADIPITAGITIQKTSSDPGVTEQNRNYSLEGAEYSVYKNKECTSRVEVIVTDSKGKGNAAGLPLGTYWIKETKASPGFEKDSRIYEVNLKEGNEATVEKQLEVEEVPRMLPVPILLKKTDAETPGKTQGTGTLEGALFRVSFFGCGETDEWNEENPLREWIMRTDEEGLLLYDRKYVVSGDEMYCDYDGANALPYGMVTFQEIKAPEGYLLNPEKITAAVKETEKDLIFYQTPIQKESVLSLLLKKEQWGTGKTLEGAVFEHIRPDGTKKTYTTDGNGQIQIKGLRRGNHIVKEISAPEGLEINKNVIRFTVEEDNQIVVTSQASVTDLDGDIRIMQDDQGCLDVVVEDKASPYSLYVHKMNEKGRPLQGAEFTVYEDSACSVVFQSAVTESGGILRLDGLIPEKDYYMKETKAPAGYRIPAGEDGGGEVWKIKASSDVSAGEFTVFVNEKAYTGKNGMIYIGGNKADREVHITVSNQTGSLLPMTGSGKRLIFILAGTLLSTGAVLASRKRRNRR